MHLTRALHDEFPALSFDFTTKIEHILKHHELFPEFAQLGCLFAVSAVESLSDTVLANLDKGIPVDVFKALAIMRQAGIALRPSLVSFTPWTTLDDYIDVFDVVERRDSSTTSIRCNTLCGSFHRAPCCCSGRRYNRSWARWIRPLSYRWTHPDPRMDELHRAVSSLVEKAKTDADPALTFEQVRELASPSVTVGNRQL